MKVSIERAWLITSIGAALAGCSERPIANQPGWYEIARAPGIVAYLDTARLERLGNGRARIWFRFAYLQPYTASNDTSVHYEASETRQELDCVNRTTRGLELRMQATGGVAVGVPAPDTVATSIDTHPLNSGVFLVACRVIGHPISPRSGT
jgi:hypothetical protein